MARQLRLRVKDGTTRCACERSSTWEAAWKLPEITQADLEDACNKKSKSRLLHVLLRQ
jgi:hypothetical protein